MNAKNVGLKIKELRKNKGLKLGKKYTGEMLASELGISRSYLGDIESGRTTPNELMLSKIADVFDVDIWDILGEDADFEIDNTPTKEELSKEKVNSIIRKIDDNTAIKTWVKNTELKELLLDVVKNNKTDILKQIRNNITRLADGEAVNFKDINSIEVDKYSWEANRIKYDYINNSYELIINKIMKLLNYELTKSSEHDREYLVPKAAHDKKGDFTEEDYKHDDELINNEELWND